MPGHLLSHPLDLLLTFLQDATLPVFLLLRYRIDFFEHLVVGVGIVLGDENNPGFVESIPPFFLSQEVIDVIGFGDKASLDVKEL